MFDRTRWSALVAAVAVTLAAGVGLPGAQATNTDGGGSGGVFVPVVPCRLFDTRATSTVGLRSAPLAANDTFTQPVTGTHGDCTVPAQATGVAMNVTAVNPTATSYLTVYPSDAPQPRASNLNWIAGSPPTPNKVDVKLSADGQINLFNNGGTVDVVGDIVGYYTDHNHDDRYYTEAEVDQKVDKLVNAARFAIVPPSVLTFRDSIALPGSIAPFASSNCVTNNGSLTEGRVPVPISYPTAHVIINVNMLDGTGAFPMEMKLIKLTMTDTGLTSTVVDTKTDTGLRTGSTFTVDLNAPVDQTQTNVSTYEVAITGLNSAHNAFCGGSIIQLPSDSSTLLGP